MDPVTLEKAFKMYPEVKLVVAGNSAVLGNGCVIEINTVISAHATIGKSTFVCAGAVINHNASVGISAK